MSFCRCGPFGARSYSCLLASLFRRDVCRGSVPVLLQFLLMLEVLLQLVMLLPLLLLLLLMQLLLLFFLFPLCFSFLLSWKPSASPSSPLFSFLS